MDLDDVVNTGVVSGSALSTDGTTLIFDSNRPGGYGGYDLWIARRVKKQVPPRASCRRATAR